MSRIVYIECKNGRPVLDEEGWGYCCETLTLVEGKSENWKPYVPAGDDGGEVSDVVLDPKAKMNEVTCPNCGSSCLATEHAEQEREHGGIRYTMEFPVRRCL